MDNGSSSENLLVKASLEAVLAQSFNRLDATARLERLKAATLMECAEKGYINLTIADVARRAKVSTATIYEDYADRDALLVAAMEMLFGIVAGDQIEVPDVADPVQKVEKLLLAHGAVYAEPLATWFFRLHVHLAWSGRPHLHEMGRRVFEGIDAFWAGFLGQLVSEGHLEPIDSAVVVPLLLGPVERCTIISRLGCGDDDSGRPQLADVARHSAQSLFALWGRGRAHHTGAKAASDNSLSLLPGLLASGSPASGDALQDRLEALLAGTTEAPSPAQRKDRILLAAAVECQERGYNAASMLEVSARARVSTATLYKHFGDKAGLFASALERVDSHQTSLDLPRATGQSAQAAIATAVFQLAARAADPSVMWMHNIVMASELSGTERVVAVGKQNRLVAEQALAAVLAQHLGDQAPSGPDLDIAINAALGAVERTGVLALILFGRHAIDRVKLASIATAVADGLVRLYPAVLIQSRHG